jgi:hypothetical protein
MKRSRTGLILVLHHGSTGRGSTRASLGRLTLLIILAVLFGAKDANSADPDLQLWFPTQFIHPFSEHLSVSMQTEFRLQSDISEMSELVYKPALNFHFNETWAFSAGYKYIDKYHEANEQDIWQESHFNKKFDDLVTGFQVRLEERFIDDISGVLPRLRFLEHVSHPIGDTPFYLTGFGAIRFNLDNKGEGPVSGFEQSRIYTALGRHIGDHTLFEVGYLWRYEEERDGNDENDHAIHFQLVFNTKGKRIKKPRSRDRYR